MSDMDLTQHAHGPQRGKTVTILWRLTAAAALLLLGATILLAVRSSQQSIAGTEARISMQSRTVYLRNQPQGGSQIVSALYRGTPVTIIGTASQGYTTWYKVKTDEVSGWLPEQLLDLDNSEEQRE